VSKKKPPEVWRFFRVGFERFSILQAVLDPSASGFGRA
jgi:hypothetical protein